MAQGLLVPHSVHGCFCTKEGTQLPAMKRHAASIGWPTTRAALHPFPFVRFLLQKKMHPLTRCATRWPDQDGVLVPTRRPVHPATSNHQPMCRHQDPPVWHSARSSKRHHVLALRPLPPPLVPPLPTVPVPVPVPGKYTATVSVSGDSTGATSTASPRSHCAGIGTTCTVYKLSRRIIADVHLPVSNAHDSRT